MTLSFRSKITLLFVGLVAGAQIATIAAVLAATQRAAVQSTAERLHVGAAVFREDLEDQKLELQSWVEVLSRDYGFVEAVGTRDTETIRSALNNHAGRVGAELALVTDLEGVVTASTLPLPSSQEQMPFGELFELARQRGKASGIVSYAGSIFQVSILPVMAPLQVAWVAMGFLIDDEVAVGLKAKTHLDVSFWRRGVEAGGDLAASTLPSRARGELQALLSEYSLPELAAAANLDQKPDLLPGTHYYTLQVALVEQERFGLHALLQTSQSEALAAHRELRDRLTAIAIIALIASVLLATFLARSLAQPIQTLVAAAQRISSGNYRRPVEAPAGHELGALASAFNEMQERIAEREEQVVHQASHDPLTGLFNRAVVGERLVAAIARARRINAPLAVLLMDLDRFKEINDKLGHKIGDLVLQRSAAALRSHVRESDCVMRLGGDEFLIILENCNEGSARVAALGFASVLGSAVQLDDMQIQLDLSIGISVYPDHGTEPDMLLRRADIALYAAKESHGVVAIYEQGQDERHLRQLSIIGDISAALQRGQFSLRFQPKVNAKTGDVEQVEALLRWDHPVHGTLRADEYIPLAEKSGHIKHITRWVIDAAIDQAHRWRRRGLNIGIAVNLSAMDLTDDSLPDAVVSRLEGYELPTSSIVVEVTETAVMQHLAQAVRVLDRFRAAGMKIALDDFGTGHSSLAQLKAIPVDELKIDKSFILQLKEGTEDEVIVRATIDLAHNMGLSVVAEGVEDETTATLLRSYGCDHLQGHLISQPLGAEEFENWVESYYGESEWLRVRDAATAPDRNRGE